MFDFFDCDCDHGHDQDHGTFYHHQPDHNPSPEATDHGHGPGQPRFGSYQNADGSTHYTSDNTDRDPVTGKILRWW